MEPGIVGGLIDVTQDRVVTLVERRSHRFHFLAKMTTASRVASRQSRGDEDQAPPHDHCDLAYLLILASPEAVQARKPRAFQVLSTIERR